MLNVSPIPRFELSILNDTEKQKHTQDTGYNVNTGQLTAWSTFNDACIYTLDQITAQVLYLLLHPTIQAIFMTLQNIDNFITNAKKDKYTIL